VDRSQAPDAEAWHYDSTYKRFSDELNAAIRREAFGEDIGQNSWLTADEQRKFSTWLGLSEASDVLDVACGSGGPALYLARIAGCRVTGVDIQQPGIDAANAMAAAQSLSDRAHFLTVDARAPLPFVDASFDAVICIDSINHMYERQRVLEDWYRVLRPGGRILFTDPITVTGLIRRDEMMIRSGGMGDFVFTAPGSDEKLVRAAGFEVLRVEDVTENMATVAAARRAARARRADDLDRVEGADANASFQLFLAVVETLARERRLSRLAYIAAKP
jgi:SAM-dependent methyltransferase